MNNAASNTKQQSQYTTGIGTHTPPIIYPLHPDFDAGSGRQILLTTDYEVLELWTPSSVIGTQEVKSSSSSSSGGGGVEGESTEQLKEDEQFPLLFEGSSFYHSSPIVHDVEGDGIADAILGDYDGNIHLIGLDFEAAKGDNNAGNNQHHQRRKRYYRRITIPRLFVRKNWFDVAINKTSEDQAMANTTTSNENHTKWEDFEPYHTYFAGSNDEEWRGKQDKEILRGVPGDVLNMDVDLAKGLAERRKMKSARSQINKKKEEEEVEDYLFTEGIAHRRLQEVVDESSEMDAGVDKKDSYLDDYAFHDEGLFDDAADAPPDGTDDRHNWGDDGVGDQYNAEKAQNNEEARSNEDGAMEHDTDDGRIDDYSPYDDYGGYGRYGYGDDMYQPEAPEGWASHEEYQMAQDEYYHDRNYLRLPPHLLSSCTLAELPRAYAGSSAKAEDRVDEMILCAVSYYFDEDECKGSAQDAGKSFGKHANADGGDETEEQRGRYVANAIVGYNLRWKYWSVQEVLDLSTDWSSPLGDIVDGGTANIHSNSHHGMGAWALASPVAAKLDGSDRNQIIVGTSMGLVYVLEAQWHSVKSGWPVQMRHPVEQKVVVEDVVGSTNLEVFVIDAGGDLVSLTADGNVLWARNLLGDAETNQVVRGTSPMSLGDVEGTGRLAIVVLVRIASPDEQHTNRPDKHEVLEYRLYAIDAISGNDLPHFPIALESTSNSSSMPQPLLIDLHEDQQHWMDQIHGLSDEDVDKIRAINVEAARQYDRSDLDKSRPHGGAGRGVHIVQPLGSTLHIIEGATSCEQTIDVGEVIPSMVQADDVHGTGGLDLVVTTSQGEILTLESDVVPYHPLNVWSAGVSRSPGSANAQAHGYSSTQGIFVHPISRQFRDILGIYVPITFEIFDRRPSIGNGDEEKDKRIYQVDIRAGMSVKRTIFSHSYTQTGVYTERIQIPYGPGYYAFSVRLRSTNGIVYEDTFHLGFNVNYMGSLWMIVCLPLILAAIPILLFKREPNWQEDDDFGTRGSGILGRATTST